jgi:DNA-binding response OmpR family regulator
MTILAVDDSSSIRALYESILSLEGYSVRTAADGLQALDELRASPPDLVLLDLNLPRLSGWDVLSAIRRTPRWADIPVVVASVLRDPQSVACGWAMDCTCYLPKPMDTEDLLLVVGRLLEQRAQSPAPAAV